jgi:hypothetical protein
VETTRIHITDNLNISGAFHDRVLVLAGYQAILRLDIAINSDHNCE